MRCCSRVWAGVAWCWKLAKESIESQSGGSATFPRAETVMISLLGLLAFLIVAIFAIKYPTIQVKRTVLVVNATLAGLLGTVSVHDVMTRTFDKAPTHTGYRTNGMQERAVF